MSLAHLAREELPSRPDIHTAIPQTDRQTDRQTSLLYTDRLTNLELIEVAQQQHREKREKELTD